MKDRLSEKPGRVELRYDDGTTVEVTMTRKDAPAEVGSAYCKANVLPDEVCTLLGIDQVTGEPKDAFGTLKTTMDSINSSLTSSVSSLNSSVSVLNGKVTYRKMLYGSVSGLVFGGNKISFPAGVFTKTPIFIASINMKQVYYSDHVCAACTEGLTKSGVTIFGLSGNLRNGAVDSYPSGAVVYWLAIEV